MGQRFYKLLVDSRANNDKHGSTQWNCICDCGGKTIVRGYILRNGKTRSCGCLHISNHPQLKHGASRRGKKIPEYMIWRAMIDRCYRTGDKRYPRYGGRGISVCERWRHDFAAFLADVGYRPAPHLSLDRINNDGNYAPGNTRWATMSEQAFNRGKRTRLAHVI